MVESLKVMNAFDSPQNETDPIRRSIPLRSLRSASPELQISPSG